MEKLLIFSIDNIFFGVNINEVESLGRLKRIRRISKIPKWIGGFVEKGGRKVPFVKIWEILRLNSQERGVLLFPKYIDYCAFLISGVKGIYELEIDREATDFYSLSYLKGFGIFQDKVVLQVNLEGLLKEEQKREIKRLNEKG
ncbi:MAG: chemotaxis protein CheW [candidate division WOR-3 bacterium]